MTDISFGTNRETHTDLSVPIRQLAQTHTHILGATGMGKTHLVDRIARDIIKAECGLILLDGKGEAYEHLLNFCTFMKVPTDTMHLIDPRDRSVPGINVLERLAHTDAVTQANLVIEAIQKMHHEQETRHWLDEWGRAILIPLILAGQSITEIFPFVSNAGFRRAILAHVDDTYILDKWRVFESFTPHRQDQMVQVVKNRFELFRLSPFLCGMFGQLKTTLDWQEVMDNRHIVLAQLAHGPIDRQAFSFVAISIINQIKRAAFHRRQRRPVFVIIDEFQNFLTPDIDTVLATMRSFAVSFILSHQNLKQLQTQDQKIYHAVMANCQIKAAFACSHHDAQLISREIFSDRADPQADLNYFIQNQPRQHYYLKVQQSSAVPLVSPMMKIQDVHPREIERYKHKVYTLTAKHINDVQNEVTQRAAVFPGQKPIGDFTEATVATKKRVPRKETVAPADEKQPSYDERRFLEYVSQHPTEFVTQIYKALGLSGYKGDRIKDRLLEEGLIVQDVTRQGKGGRLAKTILLTDQGRKLLEGLALPGKGGDRHKELQAMIKEQAEVLGWKSRVEERIGGTSETVDIGLEKDELRVAVEVSVTTDADNEVKNIQKCLAAGYDYVICAISAEKTLQALKTKRWKIFTVQERRRIRYCSPSEVKTILREIGSECLVSEKNKAFSQDRIQKQLLSTKEAAHFLGIQISTLYGWVNQGKIQCFKVGGLNKFRLEDLKAWLERRKKEESDHFS